jgi:rod shape-determining protein MreD
VSIVGDWLVLGGTPDLLLVTLVAVALLRGAMFGAACGFFAGLIVDTAFLQPLGLTSLLLTLAGYWTGRYGETTGRDRAHAPLLSVAVITVLYTCASFVLRYILGEDSSLRVVFVESLAPTVVLNVILVPFVYALVRRLLPVQTTALSTEVQLLG